MTEESYRRMVLDAATGLEALNRFTEHRMALADFMEEHGDGLEEVAAGIRADWGAVWSCLAGAPRADIAEELHDLMQPYPADDMVTTLPQ